MVGKTILNTILRRKSRRNRDLRPSAAQSIRNSGPWGAAEAEGGGGVAGDDVRELASSICPPRSPAGASHRSIATLTTPCFMLPRLRVLRVSSSSTLSKKETVASCSDLTQVP